MTDEERAREQLPYSKDGVLTGAALVERFTRETDTKLTFPAATILTRLFAEAIAHEREECAKAADAPLAWPSSEDDYGNGYSQGCRAAATAIRARERKT